MIFVLPKTHSSIGDCDRPADYTLISYTLLPLIIIVINLLKNQLICLTCAVFY